MRKNFKGVTTLAASGVATLALTLAAGTASAEDTKLRIQTHFSQETLSGELAQEFIEDISAMSNGEMRVPGVSS